MTTQTTPGCVMIVDDDPIHAEIVAETLRSLDMRDTVVAYDGSEALARLSAMSAPPDLLICDLAMPSMDGAEFLRHLSRQGYAGEVLLLSGVDSEVLRAAKILGHVHGLKVIGALAKPVSPEQLDAMLLQRGRPVQASAPMRHAPEGGLDISAEEVRSALSDGSIFLLFLPRVSIAEGTTTGIEVLARWDHPRLGMLMPTNFVPAIERLGCADEFAFAIFGKVLVYQLGMIARGWSLPVGINMHTSSVLRIDFPERLARMTSEAGVSFGRFVIELGESRLLEDEKIALDVLTRLRIMGFGLAIDNFGTGYASIESLLRLPFCELKFGNGLLRSAGEDAAVYEILSASVALARTLGLKSIAMGVETAREFDTASRMGCEDACGYYIAGPMAAGALMNWLVERERRPQTRGRESLSAPGGVDASNSSRYDIGR